MNVWTCEHCGRQVNQRYPDEPVVCMCNPNNKVTIPQPIKEGPGTELKKLISWFVWKRNCSTCATREQRMNRWGPDKCQKNMLTIIGWLRESAMKHGYPFSEKVAAALIRKAIDNSRKQS